jgi:predicted transcriptional regulator
MTTTISVRLDTDAMRALKRLESSGRGRSQIVRDALIDSASRVWSAATVRAEIERLENDPVNRAEIAEIQAFMDDDDSW